MRLLKALAGGGLLALSIGAGLATVAAIAASVRVLAVGIAVGFAGLTLLSVAGLLFVRRRAQHLKHLADDERSDLSELSAEISEISRVVDARILGLFEVLKDKPQDPDT